MPELAHIRDQWRLSKMSPDLRPTGARALSDFLRSARGRYEGEISERLGCEVTIDNIDTRTVRNLEITREQELPEIHDGPYSGFATYREGERVFITLWR